MTKRMAVLVLALCAGCGQAARGPALQPIEGADTAEGATALAVVPPGVKCIKLAVGRDGKTANKSFDVTGTSSVILDLGQQAPGQFSLSGKAYDVACATVTGTTAPSWITDVAYALVVDLGDAVNVPLQFRRDDSSSATVGFSQKIASIAVTESSTMAVLADGTVMAWGYNAYGQLGLGTAGGDVLVPTPVPSLTNVVQVVVAQAHGCALDKAGTIRCWGYNDFRLGRDDGVTADPLQPYPIGAWAGTRPFVNMTATYNATCAVNVDEQLYCWGEFTDINSPSPSVTHVRIGYFGPVLDVARRGDSFVVRSSDNRRHRLDGFSDCDGTEPATLTDAFAYSTAYLLGIDGFVRVCGQGFTGEFGNGQVTYGPTTTPAAILAGATAVAGGNGFACAVLSGGSVTCWGSGQAGALGNGSTFTVPQAESSFVGLAGPASSVSAFHDYACAILTDGGMQCWGANDRGQLGDGTRNYRVSPVFPKL